MFKTLAVLSALALSTAAFGADGKAEFRVAGGAHVAFDYEADLTNGKITGTLMRNGFNRVEFSGNRANGWTGNVGGAGLDVTAIQGSEDGVRTMTVRSVYGSFNYRIEKNRKGDLEIRAMGRNGDFLIHMITQKGAFSVSTPSLDMEVTRDTDHPTRFEGIAVGHFQTEYAELNAEGTLDPVALAKADPALFVLLYVLPFDLGN